MNRLSQFRPRVGIDLAPASQRSVAPGTARHVGEQARALFAIPVDWDWVPLVESEQNPLWNEVAHLCPEIVPGTRFSTRATFSVGRAWKRRGCRLGFATAYFVPLRGIPVVANFFDSNVYEHGDAWISSGRRWNYYLNRLLFAHTIRRAERLFVLSAYCRDVLARMFPQRAHKLVVTPCGITPPLPPTEAKPAWFKRLDRAFFLFVGVFSDNKNQRTLIDVWSKLQREHNDLPGLVLIGSCREDYRRVVIEPRMRALPRPDEVLHLTDVPETELGWAYRNALAYLQPSVAEGFGLPVAEAMSYALPVACSRSTSLPEVAGEAAIYFAPFDNRGIAECIRRLWKDAALRAELSSRGVERSSRFRWEENANLVASEISRVLGTNPLASCAQQPSNP